MKYLVKAKLFGKTISIPVEADSPDKAKDFALQEVRDNLVVEDAVAKNRIAIFYSGSFSAYRPSWEEAEEYIDFMVNKFPLLDYSKFEIFAELE